MNDKEILKTIDALVSEWYDSVPEVDGETYSAGFIHAISCVLDLRKSDVKDEDCDNDSCSIYHPDETGGF